MTDSTRQYDATKYHKNRDADKDIEDSEELTCIGMRHYISVSHGGEGDDSEIERIEPAEVLDVMIEGRTTDDKQQRDYGYS